MEKLKKCPFCGREAVVIKTLCLENNFEGYHVFHSCKELGAVIPMQTYTFDSEEEAIKVWNRRAEE